MRRIAFATLVAVSVLLVGALPAVAAVTATIQSPTAGQEITSSTGAQVRIQRQLFDPDAAAVQLRLVHNGAATSAAGLTCVQGCGQTDQTWGRLAIDPRSPDEFGLGHPLANGTWTVQTRWQNEQGAWSAWGGDIDVTVSVPPSPVTDLSADPDALDVTLAWTRAPEPDVSAYRVQRRSDGGTWQIVTSTGPSASSYQDTTPSAGTYEYRVVTVRPDGDGGVLTATSSAASVTTTSGGSDPSASDGGTSSGSTSGGGSTSDGSTSGGSTADGSGTDGSSSGGATEDGETTSDDTSDPPSDGSPSEGGAAGTDDDDGDGDGGSTSARSYGRSRVAPPPGVRQGATLDVDAQLPAPEVAPRDEERFYGEGEGFSQELDYGDARAIGPDGTGADDRSVLQRVPGGVQEFIVSRFETRTLLRSIAAGLLFVALGLHAYRWMHATPND